MLQIYVDDIIFGSTKQDFCNEFEKMMANEFEMSMIGELSYFLSLQIKQLKNGTFVSQGKYIKDERIKMPKRRVNWANSKFSCDNQILWLAQLTPCASN